MSSSRGGGSGTAGGAREMSARLAFGFQMFPVSGPSSGDDLGMGDWRGTGRFLRAGYTCNLAGDRPRDPLGGEVDLA